MSRKIDSHESLCAPDRYTHFCLTAIMVLLSLVVIGLWAEVPTLVQPAGAQSYATAKPPMGGIPDSGAQREAMVIEQRATNAKLDEILRALTGGQVKVVVVGAENKNEDKANVLPPRTN